MENDTILYSKLFKEFHNNYLNYYNNYDYFRFGYKKGRLIRKLVMLINKAFRSFYYRTNQHVEVIKGIKKYSNFLPEYNEFYNKLGDEQSRDVLLDLLLFKILGSNKYRLPLANTDYFNDIKKLSFHSDKNDSIDPGFNHFKLFRHDLNKVYNCNISLYHTSQIIYTNFKLKQYEYNQNSVKISPELGDVVIDAGACWGDTPLYFADKVGSNGKVFAFEFVQSNLEILKKNLELNPLIKDIIEVVPSPLFDQDDKQLFIEERGPASSVHFEPPKNKKYASVVTSTIDSFVAKKELKKVDYIKMDIEGAELPSLKGSANVIKKFKPKLAIAIYHSEKDFLEIYKWIDSLNLGYKFYIGHYTIHKEETVLFCNSNL